MSAARTRGPVAIPADTPADTPDETPADTPSGPGPARRRVHYGWLALALFALAWGGFEMVKHRGWTIPTGLVGLLVPVLGTAIGSLVPPLRRVLHHPVPPVLVLIAYTVFPETNVEAAPGFTLGLTWLGHIALRRALVRPGGQAESAT